MVCRESSICADTIFLPYINTINADKAHVQREYIWAEILCLTAVSCLKHVLCPDTLGWNCSSILRDEFLSRSKSVWLAHPSLPRLSTLLINTNRSSLCLFPLLWTFQHVVSYVHMRYLCTCICRGNLSSKFVSCARIFLCVFHFSQYRFHFSSLSAPGIKPTRSISITQVAISSSSGELLR